MISSILPNRDNLKPNLTPAIEYFYEYHLKTLYELLVYTTDSEIQDKIKQKIEEAKQLKNTTVFIVHNDYNIK
jgi:hypothetical protein